MTRAQNEAIINNLKTYINNRIKEFSVLSNGYTAKHFSQEQLREVYINQIFGAIMFAQEQLELDFTIADKLYVEACEKLKLKG